MDFNSITINTKTASRNKAVEKVAGKVIRSYDKIMGKLKLGGRKANYDDHLYEFQGGAKDQLRKKHYDKSLRLLWKAQGHLPWSSFKDSSQDEKMLLGMAKKSLSKEEKIERRRINSREFRDFLNKSYDPKQKQAIVNVLSLIGHGEAYAWMVSAELLNEVKSTGGRAALTMQVLEEAKHFVVLRELLQAFECEIPPMPVWEYVLLERGFKSKGLEKFFAMNVVVEGFALGLFGMLSTLPGLEILKLFHLDESRHTALPNNYFSEFPMTWWEKNAPLRRVHRMSLILPAVPVLFCIEESLAELGIDTFDFGGSMARKILNLADRVGFLMPISNEAFSRLLNFLFNSYAKSSRQEHEWNDYMNSETTKGKEELRVEKEIFQFLAG